MKAKICLLLAAQLAAASAYGGAILSTTITGVTDNNRLIEFNSATPQVLLSGRPIAGLGQNEDILGIDFRPTTGVLYALGSFGNLYTLDTSQVAQVTANLEFNLNTVMAPSALSGASFGFDFNPRNDFLGAPMLRIVSNTDQNLAVHVDNQTVAEVTDVFYPPSGSGPPANIAAEAYSNSLFFNPGPNAPTTVQYAIDSGTDMLVLQDFNNGTLTNVGPLGINTSSNIAFDIATPQLGTNFGFASMAPANSLSSSLYRINLSTGAATLVGEIDGGILVPHMSINPGIDPNFNPDIPEPTTLVTMASAMLIGLATYRRIRR